MSHSRQPFQGFPLELLEKFFLFAARSSKSTCLNLSLVSSWVYKLVKRYLHPLRIIDTHDLSVLLSYTNKNTNKEIDPFVHGIWISDNTSFHLPWTWPGIQPKYILRIFDSYQNANTIAMSGTLYGSLNSVKHEGPLYLRNHPQDLRITISSSGAHMNSTPRDGALHRLTTHLYFQKYKNSNFQWAQNWSPFVHLTHFATAIPDLDTYIDLRQTFFMIESAWLTLSDNIKLAVLVFKSKRQSTHKSVLPFIRILRRIDRRIHIVPRRGGISLFEEWKRDTEENDDIWDRAVVFTRRWEAMFGTENNQK